MSDVPRMERCPHCQYSATPDEVYGTETNHFHAHSHRCVRCGFTTETTGSWPEAVARWNNPTLAAQQNSPSGEITGQPFTKGAGAAEVASASPLGGLSEEEVRNLWWQSAKKAGWQPGAEVQALIVTFARAIEAETLRRQASRGEGK
jgi:hypothetical protein